MKTAKERVGEVVRGRRRTQEQEKRDVNPTLDTSMWVRAVFGVGRGFGIAVFGLECWDGERDTNVMRYVSRPGRKDGLRGTFSIPTWPLYPYAQVVHSITTRTYTIYNNGSSELADTNRASSCAGPDEQPWPSGVVGSGPGFGEPFRVRVEVESGATLFPVVCRPDSRRPLLSPISADSRPRSRWPSPYSRCSAGGVIWAHTPRMTSPVAAAASRRRIGSRTPIAPSQPQWRSPA